MSPDTQEHSAVAVYASHTAAEAALKALQRAGVDMKRLSIVKGASLGIPKDSVVKYETAVKTGSYLVLARGEPELVEHVRSVLATTAAAQLATHTRTDLIARDAILNLLSDDEVAGVSTAETAPRLSDGDEYLDLGQLDQGVRTASGTDTPMGRVLPRSAVQESTWREILTHLQTPYVQTTGAGR